MSKWRRYGIRLAGFAMFYVGVATVLALLTNGVAGMSWGDAARTAAWLPLGLAVLAVWIAVAVGVPVLLIAFGVYVMSGNASK